MPDTAVYVKGKFGTYRCATLAEVDRRLALLTGILRGGISPAAVGRIRHDLDLLLDKRLALMARARA